MVDVALALVLMASFLGVGIGAAMSACSLSALLAFEACCMAATGTVVIFGLRPPVVALLRRTATVRRFRQQLGALPETPHPLDRVARPRSTRTD